MHFMSKFERYVNSKDNQTYKLFDCLILSFERYVNSKDNQTLVGLISPLMAFERYVNSKDNQTDYLTKALIG